MDRESQEVAFEGQQRGWTLYQKLLALMMLITGSINTLSTKWADETKSPGVDGVPRQFDHPFFQASGMFLGELSCMVVYFLARYCKAPENREEVQRFNPLIFLPASLCDMTGTSLMYIGLTLTNAASFQMLRGAIIIFTALLSVAFLGRTIKAFMWGGMLIIVAGLVVVGMGDFIYGDSSSGSLNSVITGDELIIMAQVIVAVQMCYEERFVTRYNVPPLLAVGWEGFFGFFILVLLQIPMYFIQIGTFRGDPEGRVENAIDAFTQIGNSWKVALATIGNVVSIAFFNFSGISVTKELSATTRMVLDSMRTLVIWIISVAVQWQQFYPLTLAGFLLLSIGMCLYNDIIIRPLFNRCGLCQPQDRELLIQDRADERSALLDGRDYTIQNSEDRIPYRITGQKIQEPDVHFSPPSI